MARKVKNKLNLNTNTGITLKELYIEHTNYSISRNYRPQTLSTNEFNYQILSGYLGEDYPIVDITTKDIQGYVDYLMNERGNKPISINDRLKYIKKLLNYAYKNGHCHKVINVELLKFNQENKNPLTNEEVQILIAKPSNLTFTELKMYTICNLVLATGIRSRNVREVLVSDLDLCNRTLYLRDTKNHKPQTIYLNGSITRILSEWLRLTQLESDSPLFPTVYGEEMNSNVLKTAFRRYAYARGVKTSLHILRHTFARDLVKADVNVAIIKELLGHHSLEVTQKYIKLFSDDIRKATDGLDTLAQYQKNRIKLK